MDKKNRKCIKKSAFEKKKVGRLLFCRSQRYKIIGKIVLKIRFFQEKCDLRVKFSKSSKKHESRVFYTKVAYFTPGVAYFTPKSHILLDFRK